MISLYWNSCFILLFGDQNTENYMLLIFRLFWFQISIWQKSDIANFKISRPFQVQQLVAELVTA